MFLFEIARKVSRAIRGERSTESLIKRGLHVGKNFGREGGVRIDYSYPFMISIGDNVIISTDTIILAHDASTKNSLGISKVAPVVIGDSVFIGSRCVILPGVKIGENSIIGAGSVVTKNVPANEVWAGNPARRITDLSSYREKCYSKSVDCLVEGKDMQKYWEENKNNRDYFYQKCINFDEKYKQI